MAAISEGAYMTGLERNSDIVFAAAYAPVLNHVNATDWVCRVLCVNNGVAYHSLPLQTPNLIAFE